VGSVGIVAASRPPLQVRVWGWPADAGELRELAVGIASGNGRSLP